MEYKRGTVISCKYEEFQEGLKDKINQIADIVTDDGKEYSIKWSILSNTSSQELFGEGDKISLLVEGDTVRNIRVDGRN
jgi:hypothetical protein